MEYIPWDDSFLVGVDAFDNDHRHLLRLINNLHSGLMSGFGVSEMTYILDDLVQYTNVHFKREEDMMRKFSYPEFYKHESAHADLVRQVLDFQAQLKAGMKVFSIELMSFLRDWLINHILKTDMRYSEFFRQDARRIRPTMTHRDGEYHVSLSDMVMCLSGALDLVNVSISDHNEQVACISFFLAEALGMHGNDLVDVTLAGLLHDIGALSLKERLDLLNYDIEDTRRHSELGSRFLSTFTPLAHLAPVVRNHHARWNHGQGRTVEGRPVSDASFIIHLADRISILIDKGGEILSQTGRVIETIREGSGSIYAPEHVDAFLSIADREFFWFISTSPHFEPYLADRLRPLTVHMDAGLLMQMAKLFGRVIDFRSSFTAIHSSRVSAVSRVLAGTAGLPAGEVEKLAIAGYLHDLGKLVVPPEILDKPFPLSAEEWNVMKSHSFHTWRLLGSLKGIDTIARYASSHHERLDGKGYPFRYAGARLSEGERIVAVADVFTALIEDRPYRPGMPGEKIFEVLDDMTRQNALDGDCIDVLKRNYLEVIDAIRIAERETMNEYDAIVRDRGN